MLGRLAVVAGADGIAALKPPPGPLRRSGLIYALAGAAAAGLPLTLGWTIRHMVSALPMMPFAPGLIVACSTLSLLSLAPPLAAFFRQPVAEPRAAIRTERGLAGAAGLGLILLLAAPYQWFVPAVAWIEAAAGLTPSDVEWNVLAWSLGRAALQVAVALIILGIANRAIRSAAGRPAWTGGIALDQEPGWALPFGGLRSVVAPLTAAPWLAALRVLKRPLLAPFRRAATVSGRLERRSLLVLIIVAVAGMVAFAVSRGGS
jgi:hypothetical protein